MESADIVSTFVRFFFYVLQYVMFWVVVFGIVMYIPSFFYGKRKGKI